MQASYQLQKSPSSLSSVHQPIQETGQDSAWNHGGDAQVLTQKHPHSFTLFAKDYKYYDSLFFHEKRTMTTIIKMYHQQKEMLRLKLYTCEDRILSIFQPHVRAIVHGKAKNDFGDKIGVSIVEGYTFINHRSWDAYNENQDLVLQIQLFKERFGCLLATLLADKIYLNKIN